MLIRIGLAVGLSIGLGWGASLDRFELEPAGIIQSDVASEIAARIEKARDLLRDEGKFEEVLNLLAPLLSRLMMVSEVNRRVELSAEIFLLRGMAAVGLGDEMSARREFRSLYELGPEAAKAATKNVFDPKIIPLLRQIERESQGLSADYTLGIISDPPAAVIRIDGREIGSTPFLFKTPRPGKVVIELARAGYRPIRDEVMIDQNEMRRDYTLEFIGLTLRIRSTPPGANIFLDGRETGSSTKADLSGLALGPHQVRLSYPGYRDWETKVEPPPGQSLIEVDGRLLASLYILQGQWGGLESSLLKSPTVITVAKPGIFAVADASDSKIKMIDDSGTLQWSADPGAMAELGLLWVGGLLVDPAGNIVASDPENHGLLKWNAEGKLLGRWGSFGAKAEEFNTPLGLAGDEDGRIYVADSGNHRVKILSPEGSLIKMLGDPDVDPGRFNAPRAIVVVGPAIYILDAARIQTFSREGLFQTAWIPKGPDGEPIENPLGLAVDEAGCVYLTESKSSRVLKFDAAGNPICAWGKAGQDPGEFGEPWGLLADGTGRVFVVERGNHRIQIFTPTKALGVPDLFASRTRTARPENISATLARGFRSRVRGEPKARLTTVGPQKLN